MRFLRTLHNPTTERYAIYYSIILVAVIGTILMQNIGLLHLTPIEGIAVFVEGFISLVMLSRHSKTREYFPHHLSRFKNFARLSIPNI